MLYLVHAYRTDRYEVKPVAKKVLKDPKAVKELIRSILNGEGTKYPVKINVYMSVQRSYLNKPSYRRKKTGNGHYFWSLYETHFSDLDPRAIDPDVVLE